MINTSLHTSDFELPTELIASRMLVVGAPAPSSQTLEGCSQGGVVRDVVNYKTLPYNQKLKDCDSLLREMKSKQRGK